MYFIKKICTNYYLTEKLSSSDSAIDVYSGGSWFEFWSGHDYPD
jgi:hypothetical protein